MLPRIVQATQMVFAFFLIAFVSVSVCSTVIDVSKYTNIAQGRNGIFLLPKADSGTHLSVSDYIRYCGEYEQPLIDIMLDLMPRNGLYYLDVGSNVGVWSLALQKRLPASAKIISIDAITQFTWYLSGTLTLNGITNVYPLNAAVGNRIGAATSVYLNEPEQPDNLGSFSLMRLEQVAARSAVRTNSITSVTLDYLRSTQLFGCPSFIKLDIEMHELYALQGASNILMECHPVIFAELNCRYLSRSVIRFLESHSYVVAWIAAPIISPDASCYNHMHETYGDDLAQKISPGVNIVAVPHMMAEKLLRSKFSSNL